MALNLGLVVVTNVSGTYTPNLGLAGLVNGCFELTLTGPTTIANPQNAVNGVEWYIVIRNPGTYAVQWGNQYRGTLYTGLDGGVAWQNILTLGGEHNIDYRLT